MKTDWFRYFFVVSVIVGALLVSLGFAEIASQQHTQNALSHRLAVATEQIESIKAHETATRVNNENILCAAENSTRSYLRSYFNQTAKEQATELKKYKRAIDSPKV